MRKSPRRRTLKKILEFKENLHSGGLQKANFARLDLTEKDLSNLNLSGSKFKKANMKKANLTSAVLRGGDFQGADLEAAILTEVRAEKANFSGCFLRGATLMGAVLQDTEFYQADLTEANVRFASLRGAKLDGAILKQADFRYSFGLSYEENKYLHDNGAKVSFLWYKMEIFVRYILGHLWTKLLFAAFITALGLTSFFYFNDPIRKSVPSLMYKLQIARDNQQYEKALQIDSILIKKLKRGNNWEMIFNRKLDEARFYKFLENREKSVEILSGMLDSYGQSPEKKARIDFELALIQKLEGNMIQAISILENIDLSLNNKIFAYNVRVHLARSYSVSGQYDKATSILKKIIEEYSDNTWRQYNALHDLEQVYLRNGEKEKAHNILENLTWDPQDPLPYFRSMIDLVDTLSAKKRYQEAKSICDYLLIKVRNNSELSAKVNDRLKIIKSKIGRN